MSGEAVTHGHQINDEVIVRALAAAGDEGKFMIVHTYGAEVALEDGRRGEPKAPGGVDRPTVFRSISQSFVRQLDDEIS